MIVFLICHQDLNISRLMWPTDNKPLGNKLLSTVHTALSILMACFNIHLKYKQHHFLTKYYFFLAADDSYCSHWLQQN